MMAFQLWKKQLLCSTIHHNAIPKQSFFYWLTVIFNKVDHSRIKEVGPDRACAEWLLKNGASVKWKGAQEYFIDYNSLPPTEIPLYIQAVDGTNSAISHIGFPYFENCKNIDEMKLVNCKYMNNQALKLLPILKETLRNLEVSDCKSVTDEGLLSLKELKNLKLLKFSKLPHVEDKENIIKTLKDSLPSCEIQYN